MSPSAVWWRPLPPALKPAVRPAALFLLPPFLALLEPKAALFAAGAVKISPDDVQREVDAVFSDPAFQEGLDASHSGPEALLAMLMREIARLFLKLLKFLTELHAENSLVFWSIFILLAVVLVLILTHIGWSLSLAFRGVPAGESGAGDDGPSERTRRFQDLRAEARGLAVEGRFRDAVRFLLLALLSLLEERRVLTVARGWTNREILSRLRARSNLSQEIDLFRDAVEAACYGGLPASGEDFQRCDGTLEHLTAQIDQAPPEKGMNQR